MIDALLSWILYVGIVILCIYMVWFATVAHRMSEEGLREGFKLCLGSLAAIVLSCVALYVGRL